MPPDDSSQKPPVDSVAPVTGGAPPAEPTATVPADTTTVPPMGAPASNPTITQEPTAVPGEAPVAEAPTEEEKLPEVPTGTGTGGGGTV